MRLAYINTNSKDDIGEFEVHGPYQPVVGSHLGWRIFSPESRVPLGFVKNAGCFVERNAHKTQTGDGKEKNPKGVKV